MNKRLPHIEYLFPNGGPWPRQASTAPVSQLAASADPVKPASPPTNHEAPPAETGDPVEGSEASLTCPGSEEPASLVSHTRDATPSASDSLDARAKMTPTPPTALTSPLKAGNPSADPITSSDPHPGNPSDPIQVPNASEQAATQVGDDSKQRTQGLGAIIYSALGGSGPQSSGQRSEVASDTNTIMLPSSNTQQITTVESHDMSIDTSDIAFEGVTYSPGGPAMTLGSNLCTVIPHTDSDDSFTSDGFNGQASDLPIAPTRSVVGGHTLVSDPSGVVIDGHTLHPGSTALTMSNTPISLGGSGLLAFGSSSIILPSQSVVAIGNQTFTVNPTSWPLDAGGMPSGGLVETMNGTAITPGSSRILAIGTSKLSLSENRAFTVAGQLITPNPSSFPIAGTAISAGGPAVTVAGTVESLDPFGVLAIGGGTFTLPTPTPATSANQPLVIAGQTITPNGSAFLGLGTTLSPGGPAVTINGTIVSLQPSRTLVVGSDSFALPTPSMSIYDIDGLSVQAKSSFAVVDSVTVSPGACGGHYWRQCCQSGARGKTLDVGSGHFAMPTGSVTGTGGLQVFQGGQGRGLGLSIQVILGAWVFEIVMLWWP